MRGLSVDGRYRVVRNLCITPRCDSYALSQSLAVDGPRIRSNRLTGSFVYSILTSSVDDPVGIGVCARATATAAQVDGGFYLAANSQDANARDALWRVDAGATYTISAYVRCSAATDVYPQASSNNDSGRVGAEIVGPPVSLVPGVWKRVAVTFTTAMGTLYAGSLFRFAYVAAVGDMLDITGVLVTRKAGLLPYIDGDQPNARWDGAPNASTSRGLIFLP